MLNYGVIPIVNENDTVNTSDIKFGDNDTIASMIAILCNAKWCFLLTDVDFLYDKNPKDDPTAKPINNVYDINELIKVDTTSKGTQWGTGGMVLFF
jgi:glutamate 5-kinase